MLGRSTSATASASAPAGFPDKAIGLVTLLTVAGESARIEGTRDIAPGRAGGNIEVDSPVIAKGGFFNGNVVKENGLDGTGPVALVEEKRTGTM